jgi:hypothetical protein
MKNPLGIKKEIITNVIHNKILGPHHLKNHKKISNMQKKNKFGNTTILLITHFEWMPAYHECR